MLLLPTFLFVSLHASSHDQALYYFQYEIPKTVQTSPIYRVKIGAFSYHDNAQKAQKSSSFQSYILKGEKYYNLYIGAYHDRAQALAALIMIQKQIPDAYLITTYKVKKSDKNDYFSQAQHFFNAGDYESALALYDKEMILHPRNLRAALEYARTLYMMGFYKQAKEAFLEVLAHNPPQNVQHNIHRFLEKMRSSKHPHSFYGTLMLGLSYDDNLGYNTSHATTNYGGLVLQNDTNKTKGIYNTINLSLAHYYQNANFSWHNSFTTYNEIQYKNGIADLNFMRFSTALSKRYEEFLFSLPLSASVTYLAQQEEDFSLSTLPTLEYQFSNRAAISLGIRYKHSYNQTKSARSFEKYATLLSYTKEYEKLSLRAVMSIEEDKKIEPERFDISKKSHFIDTYLGYKGFYSTLFSLSYRYEKAHFSDIDPALGYNREDKKLLLSLALKKNFTKTEALLLHYNYLNNDSNINSYSYKKQTCTLGYIYNF